MVPSRLPLMLALVTFALAFLSGTWVYDHTIRTVPALVAAQDIPAGAELTQDQVRVIRVPAGGTPPQALYGFGQIVGKYAAVPLFQDQILSARQIASTPPTADGLAMGPGQRIVSVPVRAQTVLDGALRPGDVVDVAAAYAGADGKPGPVEVIAANIKIADIRNNAGQSVAKAGGSETSAMDSNVPTTALLAVTSAQAKTLVSAVESKATLYLWLVGRDQQ